MFTAADLPSSPVAGLDNGVVSDTLGRPLRELRLSVTDRCNFRCGYCMPKEVFGQDHPFLPRQHILSFEELTRLARVFVGLGVFLYHNSATKTHITRIKHDALPCGDGALLARKFECGVFEIFAVEMNCRFDKWRAVPNANFDFFALLGNSIYPMNAT